MRCTAIPRCTPLKRRRARVDAHYMHQPVPQPMTRAELMRQLAEIATRPLLPAAPAQAMVEHSTRDEERDLYVWFENTSTRPNDGRRGIAGLPESLLPCARGMRVVERRYVEDHMHLLCAVHLKCRGDAAERIAALYTAALSVGTVAWVGTGLQYQRAWQDMYAAHAALPRPAAG
jgi:hypothetical protein